jgi:hypothetical protein
MKATIIGSDFLEFNGSVKILEINTNTTIWDEGAELLDYDGLFNMLNENNITEFHYIYTDLDSFLPIENGKFVFELKIKEKCLENNIAYFTYNVPQNSVTVPFIEDSTEKFILRQSYDTTALVDETYCADKFEFFKLMSETEFIPKTFQKDEVLGLDMLDSINVYNNGRPNILKKYRYPTYNTDVLPSVHKLVSNEELNEMKFSLNASENLLIQEFIFDDTNIVDGRWNIIRGIDIIYGSNLDVISMGGYRTSTKVGVSFCEDEYMEDGKQLTKKSRFKWINKSSNDELTNIQYHADEESLILSNDGSFKPFSEISENDLVKSIDFKNIDNISPSDDLPEGYNKRWESILEQSQSTLTTLNSTVESINSHHISELFIKITLEDGSTWDDLPSSKFYIELANSTVTQFDTLNQLQVGDKIILQDTETLEFEKKEIVSLEVVYDEKTIYEIDVEPSDLFLVDVSPNKVAIQHNKDCQWCGWYSCGGYRCNINCPGCNQGVKL